MREGSSVTAPNSKFISGYQYEIDTVLFLIQISMNDTPD